MWPTRLQNIDEHKIEMKALEENTTRISAGLEMALQMAQMHDGKTYVVLITDGKDDDANKTRQVIDTIKHKRNIEYYTYLLDSLNLQHINVSERNTFDLLGCVPLSSPIVQSFDWWVTRDITFHPWYEQEKWYEQEINRLSNNG